MNFVRKNFDQKWIQRDKPTDFINKPIEPYAKNKIIYADEEEQLDIDLAEYVRRGPVNVIQKPYFLQIQGTHAKGTVPSGEDTEYEIIIQDGDNE